MSNINLERATFTFTQEENCCSTAMGGVEEIIIECDSDLGITRGDGNFFVIKTEQWAFDDLDELKALFTKLEEVIKILK